MWAGLIEIATVVLISLVAIHQAEAKENALWDQAIEAAQTIEAQAPCVCDECCYAEAYADYLNEFTALFNSYEFKLAKNGAPMIRREGEDTFKFVSRKG